MQRASERTDHSTLSNVAEAWAQHCALDWTIDFDAREIRGCVRYKIETVPGCSRFVVDTSGGLRIFEARVDGKEAAISWGEPNKALGRAAWVNLAGDKEEYDIEFRYATGRECSAAQWLEASQTAEQQWPYLLTQCQAIHCRSLIPIQDAPGAKLTWEARVNAPAWATVLMSGLCERAGEWHQPRKVSTYLIAVVCGKLECRDISERCKVWAEPSLVDAAAYDFAETEQFVRAAEEITALAYAWTRYDLVCLPPSFPYGGMENTNLTFVTPTLLAGDRSLAGVVAHEVAHSWTGNWVTNATWQHFWLNEGWTRWLERRIKAKLFDDPDYIDFDVALGRADLKECVDTFPSPHLTALVPDLSGGVDPDDAFSLVPYEKGSNLLYFLEHLVGPHEFLCFARAYFSTFRDRTLTSTDFRDFAEQSLPAIHGKVDWGAWFYKPGDRPQTSPLNTKLLDTVKQVADDWLAGQPNQDYGRFPIHLKIAFLDRLAAAPISANILRRLDDDFGLSHSKNAEIKFRWCKLLLKAGLEKGLFLSLDFATSQGRMKFVRPLYRALLNTDIAQAKTAAINTFHAHAHFYHPICRKMVAADLGLSPSQPLPALRRNPTTSLLFALAIGTGALFVAAKLASRRYT